MNIQNVLWIYTEDLDNKFSISGGKNTTNIVPFLSTLMWDCGSNLGENSSCEGSSIFNRSNALYEL